MIPMEEIGKRIKEEIKKKNINQEELAKKLEINKGTLSNYITGKRIMPLNTFVDLCEIIQTDILKIIYGEQSLDQEEQELLKKFNETNEERQEVIKEILGMEKIEKKQNKIS